MTVVPTYGGPLKRDMVQRAYGFCGMGWSEFDISPEDYVTGLRCMNDQMAVLGTLSGYNFPEYGDGNIEDESGLAPEDVLGAAYFTAQLLAPSIGKALTGNKPGARAASKLIARCNPTPFMEMGRFTPRGSGNRWYGWARRPYFITVPAPGEIEQ